MAFATIVLPEGLDRDAYRRAVRLGPRAVASTRPIGDLLVAARFVDVDVADVTEGFEATLRAWSQGWSEHSSELEAALGAEFDERRNHHLEMISALEDGLLRRVIASGRVPK